MNGFRVTGAYALLVFFLGFASTVGYAQTIAVPAQQRPGQQGLYKAAQMSKASTPLVRAYAEYQSHANRGLRTAFQPSDRFLPFSDGRVLVEARATVAGADLLNELRQLGLEGGSHYGDLVSGFFPVSAIDQAVALASLRSISAAIPPIRNAGYLTSQGDIALRADLARTTYNVNGSGITVGVLSDSYNTLGGASNDIGTGDLPPGGVQVIGVESSYCGTIIFCIDEGRAMLQIIYDLADGADLMFHTGLATKADYANGITALAAAGADVIVDDLLYLNEPMFQDGIVAQAVDSVAASGVVYYSAAGNAGDASYESAFVNSGEIFCIEVIPPLGDCHEIYERVGYMHDFDPGQGVDYFLKVTVPINGVLTVALQWDDPFGGAGPKNDHDLVLLDETGGFYFEFSANDNTFTGESWELVQFQNFDYLGYGTSFNLIITHDDIDSIGQGATLLKMVVFGNGSVDEYMSGGSTLFGHANAAGAEAVGAAFFDDTPEFGTNPPILEPYSSRGGTPILFNSNGSPLSVPVFRQKPEITAVDGVHTTFFFNDATGDGFDDFFGTSAAAPHAAGVAALMLQAKGNSTPAQINAALESTAIDMNGQGFDHDSGYGLIQADAAIAALMEGGGNSPPTASFTTSIADLDVIFTDTSNDTDGSVVSWNWDFGDGNGSIAQHPTHTYASDGTYPVWLTVTDNEGKSDATNQAVTVSSPAGNVPPVADFTFSTADLAVTFTDTSSDPDGVVVSWNWDFGDGNSSTVQHPSNSYTAAGTYTVILTVTDTDGESDSTSQPVTVSEPAGGGNAAPVANFTYSCNALDCMFNASDSTDDIDVTTWSWNFGDGNSASGVTASHTYASQGNYTVTLTVVDVEDASDSVSATFRVKNRGSTSGTTSSDGGGTTIEAEKGRKKCSDGIDNDGDGMIDGDDPDCQ